MLKFSVGDKIKVTTGKDKGREGDIEKIFIKKNTVLIPGVNIYKRHAKGTPGGQKGGIYEIPRPLSFSKIALICPNCKKVTRVGFKTMENKKTRICRKCGREIDSKANKKK